MKKQNEIKENMRTKTRIRETYRVPLIIDCIPPRGCSTVCCCCTTCCVSARTYATGFATCSSVDPSSRVEWTHWHDDTACGMQAAAATSEVRIAVASQPLGSAMIVCRVRPQQMLRETNWLHVTSEMCGTVNSTPRIAGSRRLQSMLLALVTCHVSL